MRAIDSWINWAMLHMINHVADHLDESDQMFFHLWQYSNTLCYGQKCIYKIAMTMYGWVTYSAVFISSPLKLAEVRDVEMGYI